MTSNGQAQSSDRPPDAVTLPDLPILVVDDDPDILRALRRVLASRGWSVLAAGDGPQALALLADHAIAVIVSDFRMPKMDGVELLGRVRRLQPHCDRILLTAFADLEAIERGVNDAGIHRILHKPCPTPVLVEVVTESVRRSRLLREHEILVERIRNRNDELTYTNRLLADAKIASDRDLKLFRRRWDAALDAISDPLVIVNAALNIEGANTAAASLLGALPTALEGQPCHRALFGRRERCAGCPIGDGRGRVRAETSPRARLYDARAYSLPGDTPAHLCVYRDITEQVAFAEEAAQLEKLAAMGRLASGVAHEINNPLQVILSFVQLAQKPSTEPEKRAHYHEVIRESAIRCRDIVQALGSFSRRAAAGEQTLIDVRPLVDRVLVLFSTNHKLHLELSPDCLSTARCRGNTNQLQQVLVNLVQNAADASPDNGRVVLSLTREAQELVVAVEDQGAGVDEAARDKIFEPFYTTKPEGMGTGLGLAISLHIVREHGGRITIGTAGLGGARFAVHLPVALESEEGKS